MNPGKLDTPVNFENPITTKGSRGEATTKWYYSATAWGKIDWGVEGDAVSGYRVSGEQFISVTVRYRDGITRKMRMRINNEYYYITGIAPVGRNQYLLIEASTKK